MKALRAPGFWLPTKTWLIVCGSFTLAAFAVGGGIGTALEQEQQHDDKPKVVVLEKNVPGPTVPGPTVYVPESEACKQAARMSESYARQVTEYSTTMGQLRVILGESSRAVYEKDQLKINDNIEAVDKLEQKTDGQVKAIVEYKALLDQKLEECNG